MNKRLIPVIMALIISTLACSFGSTGTQPVTEKAPSILYQDTLSSSNADWATGSEAGTTIEFTNGGLRIYVADANSDYWTRPYQSLPADTRIEVDATKVAGPDDNDLGIICRYQDTDNFYMALISSDGYQGIGLHKAGEGSFLTNDGKMVTTTEINQGAATNTIRFDCVGSTLSLYVNGVQVSSVTDTTFTTGGDVGVIAGTFDTIGTDILFKNFVVYQP